jgi:hypothetical protein
MCLSTYTGVNCQTEERPCSPYACGNRTSEILPTCYTFTSDKALPYICICYIFESLKEPSLALNNCHTEKLFHKLCDGHESFVRALPFTNKGYYVCQSGSSNMRFGSCALHHVWNDTQKECVPEHTLM